MTDQYGPHTADVAAFLALLPSVTSDEWEQVESHLRVWSCPTKRCVGTFCAVHPRRASLCRLATMVNERRPRLSEASLRVLRLMLEDPTVPVYGLELMDRCGVKSGTLYPLLSRLAEAGWLTAEREEIDTVLVGRPARTYYRLTDDGAAGGLRAVDRFAAVLNPGDAA